MFGKLKEKLKSALDIFSSKTEEAAEPESPSADELVEQAKEKFEPEEKEIEDRAEKKVEEAREAVEEAEKAEEDKEVEEEKKVIEVEQDEDKIELEVDQRVPSAQEILDEHFEEEKDKEKEEIEKADQIIEEAKEEPAEEVPTKYDVAKHKFEPDLEEIKEVKKPTKTAPSPPPIEEVKEELIKDKSEEKETPKKSFFGKLKEAISTKTISAEKFDNLFWDLEVALLENNVSIEVIEKIKADLKEELVDKPLPRDVPKKIEETLKKTLGEILSFDKINLNKKTDEKKPLVIAFFGINGSGKTTSIAKLTKHFQNQGKSVVLAACDTFRAAAIDQLQEHADKLDVKMIKHDYGSDAAAVAYDAVKYAEKNEIDVVLIDTAGRLHSNTNLMDELEKIIRVTKPHLKIFIGESITGNDCIEQARKFNELVEMDGSILTKADVDEKGGAPLSIAYTIKKPILFLGTGQNYEDLEEFDSEVVLGRLGF